MAWGEVGIGLAYDTDQPNERVFRSWTEDLDQEAADAFAKPRPWPELTKPTPEQWLDWMLGLPRSAQLYLSERAQAHTDIAMECMAQDHESLAAELDHMGNELAELIGRVAQLKYLYLRAHGQRRDLRVALRLSESKLGSVLDEVLAHLNSSSTCAPLAIKVAKVLAE